MAEPLKNQFGAAIPQKIAAMINAVYPAFESDAFMQQALVGYAELELMPRARHLAKVMHAFLPPAFDEAVAVLLQSLGPKLEKSVDNGMSPFLYLPHVFFVAEYGLDHFDAAMQAQYELTQRFTAEFSIRPFFEKYPEATLAQMQIWAKDPNEHVRRLVSEGSRPRLPWAPRLRAFQKDPRPVLALLEQLKDDPSLYVRRSVANNLNDIGKDNPKMLISIAEAWLVDANDARKRLLKHALRSAIKRGDQAALKLFGVSEVTGISVNLIALNPSHATIGACVVLAFEIINTSERRHSLLVDFCVHYVKANGQTRPKVFKLKQLELAPSSRIYLQKKISFAQLTTRQHYPGNHRIDILVNGRAHVLGEFYLHPVDALV